MRLKHTCSAVGVLLLAWGAATAQVSLRAGVVGCGGVFASSDSSSVTCVIGQPVVGLTAAIHRAELGFFHQATDTSGTVVVAISPALLDAPWQLTGPADFDSTGSGDAQIVVATPGDYTITWLDIPEWEEPEPNPLTFSLVLGRVSTLAVTYWNPTPRIVAIGDVGNDQGRQVRLIWERSAYDAPGSEPLITGYDIYRRHDDYKCAAAPPAAGEKLLGWDYVMMLPANGEDYYQVVAPTLCDSTDVGICWSFFMLRALTSDPYTFYDTLPDSGYSVDNLAPSAPGDFAVAYGADNGLSWLASVDEDFDYFRIYRGDAPGFPADPAHLLHTTIGTAWSDAGGGYESHYRISTVDFAGNESEAVAPSSMTGAHDPPVARFVLHAAAPNPFNPRTVIRFELPAAARADLRVYDASGRMVRRLVDGAQLSVGPHEAVWDGADGAGRQAPAGVYFYKLVAAGHSATGRMALVK